VNSCVIELLTVTVREGLRDRLLWLLTVTVRERLLDRATDSDSALGVA